MTTTSSQDYMSSVHSTHVPEDAIAIWFLGQNGFLLKSSAGTIIAIDPYLTDSCTTRFPGSRFDLSRRFPSPLQPEDLDVDFYVVTHSHADHLDEETVRRLCSHPVFYAPWQAQQQLIAFGVEPHRCQLIHPSQSVVLSDVRLKGTFAFPTDETDLNHIGLLFEFANGICFYNTGDTAYSELLAALLPRNIDLCAICINGGFHNLSHTEAARVVHTVSPTIVIPTHYDMMSCNLDDPEMFRTVLQNESPYTRLVIMNHYEPFLYRRAS